MPECLLPADGSVSARHFRKAVWPTGSHESADPPRPQEDSLKKYLPIALAGLVGATMIAPSIAGAMTTRNVAYDSTPAKGTVSVPSIGPEAYSFNQVGGEVIMRPHSTIGHVKVTMESWACESGSWQTGCTTTPGATFKTPITLRLYHYSASNPATGEIKPGKQIMSVTKTFSIRYRPSSQSATESRFMGKDSQLHNGIAQMITFPVNRKLATDVVWTVGFDTNTSGSHPLGVTSPTDSLNVGLSPKVRVGHDRFPDSIFWDTRSTSSTCGAPFVTGELNRDGACNGQPNSWAGYVPAARFTAR
jgi:hypothetical protein